MKTPPDNTNPQWEKLLQQAQADLAPPVDLSALLRVVQQAPVTVRQSWTEDFTSVFSSGRIIPACFAGAAAFALIATWQAWDAWQTLPWVQLLDGSLGGAS